MPIAHCLVKTKVSDREAQNMAHVWASEVGVAVKDVCLTFTPIIAQGGQTYKAPINLYLPALWSTADRVHIQQSLAQILAIHLHLSPREIFLITCIVATGHVVENGEIVHW